MTSSPEMPTSPPSRGVGVASLPVVFCDGDRQIDVGAVSVHPSLGFKKFQSVVGQRIGVSPQQISTSLVRRKKARTSPDIRRKVPIDDSTDFAAMAKERDCFVLAVLRRPSRRERRGRSRRGRAEDEEDKNPAPEKTILRRNPAAQVPDPMIGALGFGIWDYENQLRNLQRQRERYLMSTAAPPFYPYTTVQSPIDAWGELRRLSPATSSAISVSFCEHCEAAKDEQRLPSFHWCVYDAVTVGFRSPVGPIERPSKKRVEASA